MESTFRLSHTMVQILSQHKKWLDVRHRYTLAVMVVGLIQAETVSLTHFLPDVKSRATFAQSTPRRFARWLNPKRSHVHRLSAPLIQKALSHRGQHTIYLVLDTTMVWGKYGVIRCSVVYRGRAVPLVWEVVCHPSPTVGFCVYQKRLEGVPALLPQDINVVLLADSGFADTDLIHLAKRLDWHFRIRIKKNFWIYRKGRKPTQVGRFGLGLGCALFLHRVYLTAKQVGPVHLALGRENNGEFWYVVSSEPTNVSTFSEDELRVPMEENFLDDQSNGFQLESSHLRSEEALSRLWFWLWQRFTWFPVARKGSIVATGVGFLRSGTVVPALCGSVGDGSKRHWFTGGPFLFLSSFGDNLTRNRRLLVENRPKRNSPGSSTSRGICFQHRFGSQSDLSFRLAFSAFKRPFTGCQSIRVLGEEGCMVTRYWQLDGYPLAKEGRRRLYDVSKKFPQEEMYSLTDPRSRPHVPSVATSQKHGADGRIGPTV